MCVEFQSRWLPISFYLKPVKYIAIFLSFDCLGNRCFHKYGDRSTASAGTARGSNIAIIKNHVAIA